MAAQSMTVSIPLPDPSGLTVQQCYGIRHGNLINRILPYHREIVGFERWTSTVRRALGCSTWSGAVR